MMLKWMSVQGRINHVCLKARSIDVLTSIDRAFIIDPRFQRTPLDWSMQRIYHYVNLRQGIVILL